MDKNQISNFLTEEIAYLLGLIVGRGTIIESGEDRKIIIEFPFKILEVELPHSQYKMNVYLHVNNDADTIVRRIKKLGFGVEKYNDNKTVSLSMHANNDVIGWQMLIYLLNGEFKDYHSFRIPKAIFEADKNKQKEFLRAYFDVTGHIRTSNAFRDEDKQRVYLEVDHRNWFLVVDICKLLERVEVPIQSVDFGHPNFRATYKPKSRAWPREHQVKIFAHQFSKIGSYLEHKRRMLSELASMNGEKTGARLNYDIQMRQPRNNKEKPPHPEEHSRKLPDFIRGRHFNHYSELFGFLVDCDKVKPYE